MRKVRNAVAALLAAGLGIGLVGWGVGASFSDSGTATAGVTVGTFGCQLSSTDPNFVISNNGHTATLTLGPILSSVSSNTAPFSNLTIKNTGSIPQVVTWT